MAPRRVATTRVSARPRLALLLLLGCAAGRTASPYDALGLSARGRQATDAEVRAAYKKAALRYHPDRHSTADAPRKAAAEAKFKEAAAAYEVLSDPAKRAAYDRYGEQGLRAHEHGGGFAPAAAAAASAGGVPFFGGGGGGFGVQFGGGGGGMGAPFGSGGFTFQQFGAGAPGAFGGMPFGARVGGAAGGAAGGGLGGLGLDEIFGALFGGAGAGGIGGGGSGGGHPAWAGAGGARPPPARGARRARAAGAHDRASTRAGGAGARGAAAATVDVRCTLAQLYAGCERTLRVRHAGRTVTVTLAVTAGAAPGSALAPTRGSAASLGAAGLGALRFRVALVPHAWLTWEGDDLVWRCALTRAQARARKGVVLRLRALDGRALEVQTARLRVRNGTRHALRGEGMPRRGAARGARAGGRVERGDLVVLFSVAPR
ncbi:hypothetical protein KFE25_013226 [Diacronema lutheri]|uniref:J domain-containing protein n=1 Tax=Diacronema lutheri TaxID=2081491 RepID=A0A8J5XBP5_DIALT|nr:hypothetical protein KFE25_013226 [Diacronema lutheri]